MITLSQIKEVLGITSCTDDIKMQSILDGVLQDLENSIGDISLGDKTIQVRNTSVYRNTIGLMHNNATAITDINGTDFTTKVAGTDYMILDNGSVLVTDLYLYTDNDFGVFTITYTAGYDPIPDDIINTVANLVNVDFSSSNGQEISSETLGPRSVTYGTSGKSTTEKSKQFKKLFKAYIPTHLILW